MNIQEIQQIDKDCISFACTDDQDQVFSIKDNQISTYTDSAFKLTSLQVTDHKQNQTNICKGLRWDQNLTTNKVQFSPSRLIAHCFEETNDINQYAIANTAFTEGIHYWEILCPINVDDFQVGVINTKQRELSLCPSKFINIKATTARWVQLQLDFNQLKLKCWLNGVYKSSWDEKLTAGNEWRPCVLFKSKNIVVLNPFGYDSTNILRKFQLEKVLLNTSNYIDKSGIIEKLTAQLEEPVNLEIQRNETQQADIEIINDNLIIQIDDKLKLLKKDENNKFRINEFIFNNSILFIENKELRSIIEETDWLKAYSYLGESLNNFLKEIQQVSNNFYLNLNEKNYKSLTYLTEFAGVMITQGGSYKLLNTLLILKEKCYLNTDRALQNYSSYKKLSSFVNYVNPQSSPQQLSSDGFVNHSDLLKDYSQFENRNIIQMNDQQQNVNIPLYITINSQPHQYHINTKNDPSKIIQLLKINNQFLSSIDQNGTINLWNTDVSLKRIVIVDLKTTFAIDSNVFNRTVIQPKKYTAESQPYIYKILEDLLGDNLKDIEPIEFNFNKTEQVAEGMSDMPFQEFNQSDEESEPEKKKKKHSTSKEEFDEEEAEDEEPVVADPNYLEALYGMGFELEIAKKALIRTKNQGVQQALDIIFTIQVEEKGNKASSNQQEQKMILLPEWDCEICTFLNTDKSTVCEICMTAAPISAYFTEEQLLQKQQEDKKEQQKQELQEQKKQQDLKQQKIDEEKRIQQLLQERLVLKKQSQKFMQTATCSQHFVLNVKSKLAPFLAGGIFFKENQSVIRMRRLCFQPQYLQHFYFSHGKGFVNVISGQWVQLKTQNSLEDSLFQDRNMEFVVQSAFKEFVSDEEQYMELEEQDIQLDGKVLSQEIQFVRNENGIEKYILYILVENRTVYLNSYDLTINNKDIFQVQKEQIQIQKINTQQLQTSSKAKLLNINGRILVQDSQSINDLDNEQVASISINKSKYLNNNKQLLIQNQNQLLLLNQKENQIIQREIQGIQNFEIEHLIKLQKLFKKQICGSIAQSDGSFNYDYETKLNSKHIFQNKNYSNQFSLVFNTQQKLHSIEIIQNFKQKLTTKDELFSEDPSFIQQKSFLPLQLVAQKGDIFKRTVQHSAILTPNKQPYVSNYPKTHFVFGSLHDKQIYIQNVQINSSKFTVQGGYPIGEGLIYTFNNLNTIDEIAQVSFEEYQNLKSSFKEEYEPVGAFQFKEEETLNVSLDITRPSKYIMLLPINFRKSPQNYSHLFNKECIEIRFFGAEGYTVDENQISNYQQIKYSNLKIEILQNSQWNEVSVNKQIQIYNKQISTVQNKQLLQGVKEIRISCQNAQDLQQLTAQAFKFSYNQDINNYSATQLRDCLIDESKYQLFAQFFTNDLANQDKSREEKKYIMNLLTLVMIHNNDQIQNIYRDIDIDQILTYFVLQEDDQNFQEVFHFLRQFGNINEYCESIPQKLINLLRNLKQQKITPNGLKGFFQLLQQKSEKTQDYFVTLINEISNNLEKIKEKYNEKLAQYSGTTYFPLDSADVSEKQIYIYQEDYDQQVLNKQVECNTILVSNQTTRSYIIDLQMKHIVDSIYLHFGKSQNEYPDFQVQIYSVQEFNNNQGYQQNLEFENNFKYHNFTLMSKESYINEDVFKNMFNLSEIRQLGINLDNIQTQYLLIQISFTLVSGIKTNNSDDKLPINEITPFIYGTSLNTQETIPSLSQFYSLNFTGAQKLYINDTTQYKSSCSLVNDETYGTQTYYLYSYNQQLEKTQQIDSKKIQTLEKQINSLQTQIKVLLNENCDDKEVQINKMIKQLEYKKELLIKLRKQNFYDVENMNFNLQYINQLTKALNKCQNNHQIKEYRQQKGVDFVAEVFDQAIIKQNCIINEQLTLFLRNKLVDNLEEPFYQKFIFQTIEKYLQDASYDQEFIIQSLNKIISPMCEFLEIILNLLGIKNNANQYNQIAEKDLNNKQNLLTICYILILLKKNYETIANEIQESKLQGHKNSIILDRYLIKVEGNANYDLQAVQTTYLIIINLLKNNKFEFQEDKVILIQLLFDLLNELLKLNGIGKLQQFISQESLNKSFIELYQLIIEMNSLEINQKFQNIFISIIQQKDVENDEKLERKQLQETRFILIFNLHQIFEILLVKENIQQLQFLVNTIIQITEQIQKDNVKRRNLQPRGNDEPRLQKSQSICSEFKEPSNDMNQFVQEQNIYFNSNTINKLINLIKKNPLEIQVWNLIFNCIPKSHPQTLIERDVIQILVNIFLKKTNQEFQSILVQNLLQLFQKLLNSNILGFTSILIDIVFDQLDNIYQNNDENQIRYSLLAGSLDILISRKTPKDTQYIDMNKAFGKLSYENVIRLLTNISIFLIKNLNLGGRDAFTLAQNQTVQKLQIADDLLYLLLQADSQQNNEKNALQDFFGYIQEANYNLQQTLKNLLQWFIINQTTEVGTSPSTVLIKNISEHVFSIFIKIAESSVVTEVCLDQIIKICKNVDTSLIDLYKQNYITSYTVYSFNQKNCKILETLLDIWITSDKLAEFASFKVGGITYLLDRMGITNKIKKTKVVQIKQNLLQSISNKEAIKASKEDNQNTFYLSKGLSLSSNLELKEFSGQIQVVSNSQNTPLTNLNWDQNKYGNKDSLFTINMNGNSYQEYSITLKLEQVIEPKQIMLGFKTGSEDIHDKVIGIPSQILLEGGCSLEKMNILGQLEYIEDEGYSKFQTKVFTKNFQMMVNQDNNLNNSLKSLKANQIQYLRFKFKRPIVSFVEDLSSLSNKLYQKIGIQVSFLSIMGYEIHNLENQIIHQQQASALQILSKLCSQQFKNTLTLMANDEKIINNLKQQFSILQQILPVQGQFLVSVLLAISKYNKEMGNWMIDQLMNENSKQQHANLIQQIVLSDTELSFERVLKVYNFIFKLLADKSKEPLQLIDFIPCLNTSLRILSKVKKNIDTLSFSLDQLSLLLHAFITYKESISPSLISLACLLIYLPKGYQNSIDVKIDALSKIHEMANEQPIYFDLLTSLMIGDEASIKWFQQNDNKLVDQIFAKTLNISPESEFLNYYLKFLNSISTIESIKEQIKKNQWHIILYKYLKTTKKDAQNILVKTSDQNLKIIVQILKNVILGDHDWQDKFARILKEDINQLIQKRDMEYVYNFLVPLLYSEIEIPVCFHYINDTVEGLSYFQDLKQIQLLVKKNKQLKEIKEQAVKQEKVVEKKDQTIDSEILRKTGFIGQFNTACKRFDVNTENFQLQFQTSDDKDQSVLDVIHTKCQSKPKWLSIFQGKNNYEPCVIAVYSYLAVDQQHMFESDNQGNIPYHENSFCIYIEKDRVHPFKFVQDSSIGIIYNDQDGGDIVFTYLEQEFLNVSFSQHGQTFIDINSALIKDIDGKSISGISSQFVFESVEFYNLVQQNPATVAAKKQQKQVVNSNLNFILPEAFSLGQNQFYQNYREQSVYMVPSALSLLKIMDKIIIQGNLLENPENYSKVIQGDLEQAIGDIKSKENQIIDLFVNGVELLSQAQTQGQSIYVNSSQNMKLFEAFEKNGGVQQIISVIKSSIGTWKNKNRQKKWLQFIDEIQSFSCLPNFFILFMKSKERLELLFSLLAGKPDEPEGQLNQTKNWDEEEQNGIKFSYQILSDVFSDNSDVKIREFALENNFINTILNRIGIVSKEDSRFWKDELEVVQKTEEATLELKRQESDNGQKVIKKKKGVGYASDNTGQNQKWNVNDYIDNKKKASQQIISLMGILESYLDFKNWAPPEKLRRCLCESSFLPLLESVLRGSSLLEMSKEFDLVICYLNIINVIAKNQCLIPILQPLDPHYQPKQLNSILQLLTQLKDTAKIFTQLLKQGKDSSGDDKQQQLAERIINVYDFVDSQLEKFDIDGDDDNEQYYKDLLKLPIEKQYFELLKDLRFDYISMKDDNNKYKHYHHSSINPNSIPSHTKMIRLAQEFADMSTALPIEHTNSIFVRCDSDRVDVMKAIIFGAAGTPYAHGAFMYDIYFDDNYPNGPPKCQLVTTGSGKVRFNPNLYACGKVCLSLLGTWRGNASENWDPKISTLLQILVSLQAIIMSEEVYFNEPGFEGEQGTKEGENKNEAYSNIVRYCNIKFAMIDMIKNPPKGFESVIQRHFYLKKEHILKETQKWIKYAKVRDASYINLVSDHNSSWCSTFKQKGKYLEMLTTLQTELETVLNNIPIPHKESKKKKNANKTKKVTISDANQGIVKLENIDVSYNEKQEEKELDINDEKVKDRWSRYIGAMGIDAVAKQSKASIFISGLGPLGIEIAKNLILGGVKKITLHDDKDTTYNDLSGQFYLSEQDIGKNRIACMSKLAQLNYYVKVDKFDKKISELSAEQIKQYDMIILTEQTQDIEIKINNICRENKVKFICTDIKGVFARSFNDFNTFEVVDITGEDPTEVMIQEISKEGVVTLLQGVKHNYQDGDSVIFSTVEGMETDKEKDSINGKVFKIEIISFKSFKILGDLSKYSPYVRNGIAKNVKIPKTFQYKSLEDNLKEPLFDSEMMIHDYMKMENTQMIHQIFQSVQKMDYQNLKSWNFEQYQEFKKLELKSDSQKTLDTLADQFILTPESQFPPLCAFMGGLLCQEIIKGITQKFKPAHQFIYTDCIEVLQEIPENIEEFIKANQNLGQKNRYDGVKLILGNEMTKKLQNTNLFMIGCGAIGCELLKNYAMLNVATEGKITITDPDHIETSNLNRQFLFREKHIKQPKSSTGAASIIQMNPMLKNHIDARLDMVHEGTKEIFNDKFFQKQNIIMNALDNVKARIYVDLRCVDNKIPLIESGTLGPKGHVQVIIPNKTESYGSQQDPQEEGDVPVCTLKMFPEEATHCVEWAMDKFQKMFNLRPKALENMLLSENIEISDNNELQQLQQNIKILKKYPKNFNDCIVYAANKFNKYFIKDIKQLLYTYPKDAMTKGQPFWKLPKRMPHDLVELQENNPLHLDFITAFAVLRAKIFNIQYPMDFRSKQSKDKVFQEALKVILPKFVPNDKKAAAIKEENKKADEKEKEEEKKEEEPINQQTYEEEKEGYISEFNKLKAQYKIKITTETFEKDEDQNGHIDFIYALTNLRCRNYGLQEMDWISTKLKAGKIVPALATTTAAIAGLQTIELVKVIKGVEVDKMKSGFLNLAYNIMQLSEPGPCKKIKIHDSLIVTLWDKWQVQAKDLTIQKFFQELQDTYKLKTVDLFQGGKQIYSDKILNIKGKEKEKENILKQKLTDILEVEDEDYQDVMVTFKNEDKDDILEDIPMIRLHFK